MVNDLGVSFSRSSNEGPFSGSNNFPRRLSLASLRRDGQKKINAKDPKYNPLLTKNINPHRIATDRADVIKEFHKSKAKTKAAISFAPRYFELFFNKGKALPRPMFYECWNEPLVRWREFRLSGRESEVSVIRRLAKICGRLCKSVKARNPGMVIGGPATAFTRPFYEDFNQFKRRVQLFIDQAKSAGCLDFVSQHLYDTGGGVLDGNLDLMETYTARRNKKRQPMKYVVSEMGSYSKTWFSKRKNVSSPPRSGRDFLIIAENFKNFMSLLRVHDNVQKIVSFLTLDPTDPRSTKKYRYPWSLIEKVGAEKIRWTPLLRYFQLLKGISGRFAFSHSSHADIKVHAVVNRQSGFIMMQNLHLRKTYRTSLRFPYGLGRAASRVIIRQLWLNAGKPGRADRRQDIPRAGKIIWSNKGRKSVPKNILLRPEAMYVMQVIFKKKMSERRSIGRFRRYVARVSTDKGKRLNFPYRIEKGRAIRATFAKLPFRSGVARIRISQSRRESLKNKPDLWLNGKKFSNFDASISGGKRDYHKNYFGTYEISVPLKFLASQNNPVVRVKFPDSGGHISTFLLEVDTCGRGSCCLLNSLTGKDRC